MRNGTPPQNLSWLKYLSAVGEGHRMIRHGLNHLYSNTFEASIARLFFGRSEPSPRFFFEGTCRACFRLMPSMYAYVGHTRTLVAPQPELLHSFFEWDPMTMSRRFERAHGRNGEPWVQSRRNLSHSESDFGVLPQICHRFSDKGKCTGTNRWRRRKFFDDHGGVVVPGDLGTNRQQTTKGGIT